MPVCPRRFADPFKDSPADKEPGGEVLVELKTITKLLEQILALLSPPRDPS
jgi:hypothetical protein